MGIRWLDGGCVRNGAYRLLVSHNQNGLFDDVSLQELTLLRSINEMLADRVSRVGLLSISMQVQPDSKVLRRIGYWSSTVKAVKPMLFADSASYFSITINVDGGVCLLGGVIARTQCFEEILHLAKVTQPSLFVWNCGDIDLRKELDVLATQGLVLTKTDGSRACHLSSDVLFDFCRGTGSCICIPSLEIDVSDAQVLVIDPLNMLVPILRSGIGVKDFGSDSV